MCAVLTIDLDKIRQNAAAVVEWCKPWQIAVYGVTKVVQGDPLVARAMIAGGCSGLCDSRWQNLRRLRQAGISTNLMLIRSSGLSEASETVRYANISLQTEAVALQALSAAAVEQSVRHQVILMVEAGDLREGKSPEEVVHLACLVESLPGLTVAGIGVNWGCLAGEAPTPSSQRLIEQTIRRVEKTINRKLEVISGGNSSTLPWLHQQNGWPAINHLRIGETIMLGKDPLSDEVYPELWPDAFVLRAEVIEVGTKPIAASCHHWERGSGGSMRIQALLDVGIQDIGAGRLYPREAEKYRVIGVTSDHLVVEILPPKGAEQSHEGGGSYSESDVAVGDTIDFIPDYEALLGLMTSPYVKKLYIAASSTDVPGEDGDETDS